MNPTHIFATLTALIATLTLTPIASRLALHFGFVDHPSSRKVHLAPIPLLGGLAIYGGTVLAVALFAGDLDPAAQRQIGAIGLGASLLVIVGGLDDGGMLHHQIKLMVAMPLATGLLMAAGIRATVFEDLLGAAGAWIAADVVLTLFWVVGITAAFSILDHMDGLCAGIASIAAAFFLVHAASGGQVLVGTLAAAVLGAALGFLRFNFNPARIFMGDGGAMFLGFMMATLGLKLRVAAPGSLNAALVPLFVLGAPILDTTLVVISRARRGLVPFSSPGKDHSSHRLSNCGLGHKRAVLAMYAIGTASGAVSLALVRVPPALALAIAVAAGAVAAGAIVALERCPFDRQ